LKTSAGTAVTAALTARWLATKQAAKLAIEITPKFIQIRRT